jgi:Protein of unknown function (DUF2786)
MWVMSTAPPSPPPFLPVVEDDLLARVRALLAKAESSTFEEEANAFTAKAQELMARHAIDQAMLAAVAHDLSDVPSSKEIPLESPYAVAKALLLTVVGDANRCRVLTRNDSVAIIFGFASDIETVEMLYTSLLTQSSIAMMAAGPKVSANGESRTRSFRNAFIQAFSFRVGERLRTAQQSAHDDASETFGAALVPVLADRQERVDLALAKEFPRARQRTIRSSNADGWAAGRQAADAVPLTEQTALSSRR